MLSLLLLVAHLQVAPADTIGGVKLPDDAYLDAGARMMVERARAGRAGQADSLLGYRVVARERIEVGLKALTRDRALYHRELAARVHWRREGPNRVELLGARERVPMAHARAGVPDDAGEDASGLAFDPADELLLERPGRGGSGLRHPLAAGSEAHYRFASGDTTRLRLADGTRVTLVELRVLPRRRDGRLVRGSLWLDSDSHAPVRGVFTLSRPLDIVRDLADEDDDANEVPRLLRPLEADLRFLTVEYGLWQGRFWLPRLVAMEGEARAGRLLRVPVRFERAYSGFELELPGGEPLAPREAFTPPDSAVAEDSASARTLYVRKRRSCEADTCPRFIIERPADSLLLASPSLRPDGGGPELISEREIRELGRVLSASGGMPLPWQAPELRFEALSPGLVRYNRIEGLALGARLDADLGPLRADLTGWLGTADLEPAGELGITRSGFASARRLAAYRRLDVMSPAPRALDLGSSLSALLLGRDEAFYHRSLGLELLGSPAGGRRLALEWRAFAERQSAAEKSTDASLPRLLDGDRVFPENVEAVPHDRLGAALRLLVNPSPDAPLAWGAELALEAAAGTADQLRPYGRVSATAPLAGALSLSAEAAAGALLGDETPQARWYLGGPATVRGYGIATGANGRHFWRTRVELARGIPAARLALFSDAAAAGDFAADPARPDLLSAGIGASFLGGLARLDLARALRGETGWRLDLHLDAPF